MEQKGRVMTFISDIKSKISNRTTVKSSNGSSIIEHNQEVTRQGLITREAISNAAIFMLILIIVLVPAYYIYKASLWENCVGSSFNMIDVDIKIKLVQKCSEILK
jgi:hypothetical protein